MVLSVAYWSRVLRLLEGEELICMDTSGHGVISINQQPIFDDRGVLITEHCPMTPSELSNWRTEPKCVNIAISLLELLNQHFPNVVEEFDSGRYHNFFSHGFD